MEVERCSHGRAMVLRHIAQTVDQRVTGPILA
jgi:hypothetical protein